MQAQAMVGGGACAPGALADWIPAYAGTTDDAGRLDAGRCRNGGLLSAEWRVLSLNGGADAESGRPQGAPLQQVRLRCCG